MTNNEIVYIPTATTPLENQPQRAKSGRKSDQERLEIKAELTKAERVAYRESRRAVPLLPDTKASLMAAVALVSVLMLSSFTVSFSGIYTVSAYTGLPDYLQWLPALFIDAAILAYTIALLIFKSRGVSTWRTMAGLAGFATLSVAANVAHTVAFWNGDLADWRAWVGVVITAAAPIAVLLASEEIARLAFSDGE